MCKFLSSIIMIAGLFLAVPSHAFTLTQSGANVDVSFTEPTTNDPKFGGAPLTDLDHTSIFFDAGSGGVKAADVPASSPSGGGPVAVTVTVPIVEGMEADVIFFLSATDKSGNESDLIQGRAQGKTLRIDRLAPAIPE